MPLLFESERRRRGSKSSFFSFNSLSIDPTSLFHHSLFAPSLFSVGAAASPTRCVCVLLFSTSKARRAENMTTTTTPGGKAQHRQRRRMTIDLKLVAFFFAAFVAATAFARPALAAAGTASVTGAIAWPGEKCVFVCCRYGEKPVHEKPSIAHSFFFPRLSFFLSLDKKLLQTRPSPTRPRSSSASPRSTAATAPRSSRPGRGSPTGASLPSTGCPGEGPIRSTSRRRRSCFRACSSR